jgi:hypothetical protein
MAANISVVILGFILGIIGGYIIKKTRSGRIGFLAGILFLIGVYLVLVGAGVFPSFF